MEDCVILCRYHPESGDYSYSHSDQLMLLFSLSSNDLSPLYQARCAATKKLIADHGPNAYLIPSSDHPHIIAGQGSIAVEFLEQVASFFKYQSNV